MKKIILPFLFLILITGLLFLITKYKPTNTQQEKNTPVHIPTPITTNNTKTEEIPEPAIQKDTQSSKTIDWETYANDKYGFYFKYPKGYKVEERVDGFFMITSLDENVPQAGISIDARQNGIFKTYEDAVNYYITSLNITEINQQKDLTTLTGIGKEEMTKGIEFQNAIFRYKTGAIGIETINKAPYKNIFKDIVLSFKIN